MTTSATDRSYQIALELHGHRCPGMAMGLRAATAAMSALATERANDGQLMALVELGEGHCATCFADGVQSVTGCTFGKGNIKRLDFGKWGLTLIDKAKSRAVRVVPRAEVMQANAKSDFMLNYRRKGVPASQVPEGVAMPLVNHVLEAHESELLKVGPVVPYSFVESPHNFSSFTCEICGEFVSEKYGRLKDGKHVCKPCSEGENVSDREWVPLI